LKTLLIVAVRGMSGALQPWQQLERALSERGVFAGKAVRWHHFDRQIGPFSRVSLDSLALELDAQLAQEWQSSGPFDEIILTGHSLGALVVRKAWLNAIDPGQHRDYTGQPWGKAVSRFVLFAGVSRGVDMERPLYRKAFGRFVDLLPGRFTSEDCFRGSAFITNLRISWIRQISAMRADERPVMVQLLGTRDGIVNHDDSIDLDAFPDAPPRRIAGATHDDLHMIEGREDREGRLAIIASAFTSAAPAAPTLGEPRRVLMIVHGIRASRTDDWVQNAVDIVKDRWPEVITKTPTYGYLSALRFALPSVRRRYGRHFRDFYTETIASHRGATVSALCHSNGSYTLGRCLDEFDAIKLDRVVLAGSVLPATYNWTKLLHYPARISAIRNDCGSRDYPVALLCSALRGLGMNDVGTGGFDGFRGSVVDEVRFHPGGHGAMLNKANLNSMLSFLLDGQGTRPDGLVPEEAKVRRLSRLMPYLAMAIVATVLAGALFVGFAWGWLAAAAILAALLLVFIALDVI
jgi:hypothetical protein